MPAILATTDLSPRSEPTLQRAAQIAAKSGHSLHIVHVIDSDQGALLPQALIDQTTALFDAQVSSLLPEDADEPVRHIRHGSPFDSILALATEIDAELIVVGGHRHNLVERVFVGTTGERVMRLGSLPVLRAKRAGDQRWRKIVAATDMSACSARALHSAYSLNLVDDAEVVIAHIFDPVSEGITLSMGPDDTRAHERIRERKDAALSEMAEFLRQHDLERPGQRLLAIPARAFNGLQEVVNGESPDLVIMGTRGLSGVQRLAMGSLAESAVRDLQCDVLVVPPEPE
jgi:universal stress protein E